MCSGQPRLGRHTCLIFLFGLFYTTGSLPWLQEDLIGWVPKTDGVFVYNDKCLTVAANDERPWGDITTHLREIHEGFMTRLNPDRASLSWPSGNQLSGMLALSLWAMCLESLWNLGAGLFVKHRVNYQKDLEIGNILLSRSTAMFAKYIDENTGACIQDVHFLHSAVNYYLKLWGNEILILIKPNKRLLQSFPLLFLIYSRNVYLPNMFQKSVDIYRNVKIHVFSLIPTKCMSGLLNLFSYVVWRGEGHQRRGKDS